MARTASWEYLKSAVTNKPERFEKLCEWFFNGKPTIEKCAEYAYGDLCRRLDGFGKNLDAEKQKEIQNYKDRIIKYIKERVEGSEGLLNIKFSKEASEKQATFDNWHKITCDEICNKSLGINKYLNMNKDLESQFTYGLAQKWLNMTLKNMLVAETADWYKGLNKIRDVLHVPVDSYVRNAAHYVLGIRGNNKARYAVNNAWSKWDYNVYDDFQKAVREAIQKRADYDCPMDWEFDAWEAEKSKT